MVIHVDCSHTLGLNSLRCGVVVAATARDRAGVVPASWPLDPLRLNGKTILHQLHFLFIPPGVASLGGLGVTNSSWSRYVPWLRKSGIVTNWQSLTARARPPETRGKQFRCYSPCFTGRWVDRCFKSMGPGYFYSYFSPHRSGRVCILCSMWCYRDLLQINSLVYTWKMKIKFHSRERGMISSKAAPCSCHKKRRKEAHREKACATIIYYL